MVRGSRSSGILSRDTCRTLSRGVLMDFPFSTWELCFQTERVSTEGNRI